MAVTISGTTGVGVSTTPSYPVDVYVGTLGTTANSQLVGARLQGSAGGHGDILEVSQVRGSAGTDWQTAGWRLQQRVDSTWMGYIQFNGTASGTNNFGISIGTGSSAVNANAVTERLRIDASGRVTMPAQPAFLANHNVSTATAPSEIIWAQAVQFNIGSCYSSTTGRFTAPVSGTYFFRAHTLTANATAGETRLALYKNGVAYGGSSVIVTKVANTWQTIMVHSHMYLAAGDYASVFVTQVAGSVYSDFNFNSFSGHLVG